MDGYALFDAKFVIGHRGNTVPERSGVALSFRGRPRYLEDYLWLLDRSRYRPSRDSALRQALFEIL
ncbi:hypothetical protein CUN63_23570 [Pseudomonas sp. ACM7]|nr:hypothetical protein CUN63_23570 [Pseudomonas sp. ACM7]